MAGTQHPAQADLAPYTRFLFSARSVEGRIRPAVLMNFALNQIQALLHIRTSHLGSPDMASGPHVLHPDNPLRKIRIDEVVSRSWYFLLWEERHPGVAHSPCTVLALPHVRSVIYYDTESG